MPEYTTNEEMETENLQPCCDELVANISDCLSNDHFPRLLTCDIMTRDIKMLTLDDTVSDFLAFMQRNKVRHVVIFDPPIENEPKPFFVGIVSERDILRIIHPYADKDISVATHSKTMGKPLVQIVTRNPICASPDTPVDELITVMIRNQIDMVPVFDETELVGIVTTTDIIKFIIAFKTAAENLCESLTETPDKDSSDFDDLTAWISRTAESIMPSELYFLNLEDTLRKAISVIRRRCIRHIVVTDKNDQLVGVASDRDVLRHLPYANLCPFHKPKHEGKDLYSVEPDALELHAPVANIMTWEPVYIKGDCTVIEAAEMFVNGQLSCLPVFGADENLSGIITVTDLMQVLLQAIRSHKDQQLE